MAHLFRQGQARRNRSADQGDARRATSRRADLPGESRRRFSATRDLRQVSGLWWGGPPVRAGPPGPASTLFLRHIMQSSIDRRRFIQIAGAGAAAATQIGCGRHPGTVGQRIEVPTTCELCPNKCSVIAVVEDGLIRKLNPNPENPKSRGMLCARGNAGVLQVYDPNRLKKPLIRAGARGEGKWSEVSWEEAFDYSAKRLSAIKEKYGPEGVLWSSTEAFSEVFFKNLGLAFGSPNIVRHPTLCLASVNLAYSITFGTVPSFDLLNANYVIMAGANRFEAIITPDTMDLIDSTMN